MTGLPERLAPARAPWLFSAPLQTVLSFLAGGGFEGRVVGGAVRNTLLGEPVTDIDIATPASPEEVVRLATAGGLKVVPTGIAHGTVTVVADHRPFEVTTLRRDVETFGRHATVVFTDDWAEDARRRDFTINALYCAADGTLHDPVGGLPDLARRHVRFIGDAAARIAEDYLRILRFFRFMAQYQVGPADADGLQACVRGRRGLDVLSGERVRQETVKLVVARGAPTAVRHMLDLGLVTELYRAVPNPAVFARMVAVEAAAGVEASAMRRLAALLVSTSESAARLADRLKVSKAERDVLMRAVPSGSGHNDIASPHELVYREGRSAAIDRMLFAWAHRPRASAEDTAWRERIEAARTWAAPRFPLGGADVTARGIAPGARVGEILREIEADWIAGGFVLDREALLARLDTTLKH